MIRMTMFQRMFLASLVLCSASASAVDLPAFSMNSSGNDTSRQVQGGINDDLYYAIGGGTVVSNPPSGNRLNKIGMGVGWNADLMCGNFDVKTTVKNQLNGLTSGFKDMMGDVISSATGAVASLPAMVIQRANPGLYELLTNGTLQANAYFDKAQLNCQAMSKKLADHTLSGPWVQAAVGEEYQNALSGTSDAVKADQQLSKSTGTEGVSWVGGKKRGGKGQAAIRPTHDIARAGYNILNKQAADSSASISESACNGALCRKYKNGDEAAQVVASVLGDRSIRTCKSGNECASGGLENEPGTTTPGTGFTPMLDETTQKNYEVLVELVNGSLPVNAANLAKLKTGGLTVTRGVVQALKDDPDNTALVQRLASELAMADTVATAFGMRRMLTAGQSEPHVAEQQEALTEAERRLEFLDWEIVALKNEMELRKQISNNTIVTALSRQTQRGLENSARQKNPDADEAVQQLGTEVAP
ncbi:TPA: integrating conjugative element protein [Klebsiella pneumoniae]|uniref:integrating conjugative element protein n=1 Tax=Klebsiella pneumoniae TaxID=573 RepID=UPI000E2C33F7|nr:integrating conjugative element protein [Klebsiella pneumoniae]HDS2595389.1 integrating conjugative element protein [Klebsiella pneumoniae subsp. pneumoniae]MDG3468689.1 integrating conjugative element protein [Klebsiella pneumoniae]MDS0189444.1 integrating conjugative element protein [Klebsiella pneumoniae]MDS1045924.1 integrating conjugative element protein [Klebsiella pneumoniae]MDS1064430.1 integrating conjugative element protein [Klebsiella pneumoniae]